MTKSYIFVDNILDKYGRTTSILSKRYRNVVMPRNKRGKHISIRGNKSEIVKLYPLCFVTLKINLWEINNIWNPNKHIYIYNTHTHIFPKVDVKCLKLSWRGEGVIKLAALHSLLIRNLINRQIPKSYLLKLAFRALKVSYNILNL